MRCPPSAARRNFPDNPRATRRVRAVESCPAAAGNTSFPWSFPLGSWDTSSCQSNRRVAMLAQLPRLVRLFRAVICQGQNSLPFLAVVEGMKPPDFIKTTDTIKRLQVTCVARGELAGFQITATQ